MMMNAKINMVRIAAASIRVITISILTCLFFGCSIFDLRTPEPPITGVVIEDPLNIGDILRVASESAVSMDYQDYFAANVRFEYASALRPIEGRVEVIRMLNRLRSLASHIEWQVERGEKTHEGNLQILKNVPYIVVSRGETFTGIADFHIVRETDWTINYWKDMPDAGSAPFFEP